MVPARDMFHVSATEVFTYAILAVVETYFPGINSDRITFSTNTGPHCPCIAALKLALCVFSST